MSNKNSVVTHYMDNCFICGRPSEEIHHLVYGRGIRELADKDGLTVCACRECHEFIHKNNVAGYLSKIAGQLAYEKNMVAGGMLEEDAREHFRKRYGRSCL